MDDEAVYKTDGVIVTKTLARFGEVSYPINSIGSVRIQTTSNAGCLVLLGIVLALFGLGLVGNVSSNPGSGVFGFALLLVAVLVFVSIRHSKRHKLMLRTASGDQQAFESRDKEAVEQIKDAIERAVIMRG